MGQKNAPKDHHYVPVFYLSQWHRRDSGKLIEFRRIGNRVLKKHKQARSTGYQPLLYSRETAVTGEYDHSLESGPMKELDQRAALALQSLVGRKPFDDDARRAFATFIVSLDFRMPEDIQIFEENFDRLWTKTPLEHEQEYQQTREPDWPMTLAELLSETPKHERAERRLRVISELILDNRSIPLVQSLKWSVRTVSRSRLPLVTSDRPIVRNLKGLEAGGYIFMPLSPRMIFFAVKESAPDIEAFSTGTDDEAAFLCNHAVASQAHQYVWTNTEAHEAFVSECIGSEPQKRIIEIIHEHTKKEGWDGSTNVT